MHMYPKAHLIPGEVMSILGFGDFCFVKILEKKRRNFLLWKTSFSLTAYAGY